MTTPTRATRGCCWVPPNVPPQASCKLDLPTPALTGYFLSALRASLSFRSCLVSACPCLLLSGFLLTPPLCLSFMFRFPASILRHRLAASHLFSFTAQPWATRPLSWLHRLLAYTSVIPNLCLQPSHELETRLSHRVLMSICI